MRRVLASLLVTLTGLTACQGDLNQPIDLNAAIDSARNALAGQEAPRANAPYATSETQTLPFRKEAVSGSAWHKLTPYAQPQSAKALRGVLGLPNTVQTHSDGSRTEIYQINSPDGIVNGGRIVVQYDEHGRGTWYLG